MIKFHLSFKFMAKVGEQWQDLHFHLKRIKTGTKYINNGTQDIDYKAMKENDE